MKHPIRWVLYSVLFIPLIGCAKIKHLDQLLTLKAVSEEQDAIKQAVANQDRLFLELLDLAENKSLDESWSQATFVERFGQPVFRDVLPKSAEASTVWMYRRSVTYQQTDKLYLYFDNTDKLSYWTWLTKDGQEIHSDQTL